MGFCTIINHLNIPDERRISIKQSKNTIESIEYASTTIAIQIFCVEELFVIVEDR